MITVIYGKPSTGKTRHAERFRVHYGCQRVLDFGEFAALDNWTQHRVSALKLRPGDLILTNAEPGTIRQGLAGHRFQAVEITHALQAIGVTAASRAGDAA